MSGAPAHSTSWASGANEAAARTRCATPFWRVIRPTNTTAGRAAVDAEALEHVGARVRRVLAGVDPVVDHLDAVGIDRRIAGQDVAPRSLRDRDHAIGALQGDLLAEARQCVAAAELFGLPRPQRLERVHGRDMGDAVDQLGQVAGELGVPGVAVDELGVRHAGRHQQIDRDGLQGGEVRRVTGQRIPGPVGVHSRVIARLTPAVDD